MLDHKCNSTVAVCLLQTKVFQCRQTFIQLTICLIPSELLFYVGNSGIFLRNANIGIVRIEILSLQSPQERQVKTVHCIVQQPVVLHANTF